jgi:H+/Cl- antiporter ClcA
VVSALVLGIALGTAAAVLCVLAHPNQTWRSRPLPRAARVLAGLLAVLAAVALCGALGIGPGLVATLCLLQLAALAMPYLAWWRGAPR